MLSSVGGYSCRRNTADTARMSVHGTGRALDVFIPKAGNTADNAHGDKVANWLVVHAQQIGVQLIIWDRSIWRANGTNAGAYGGPHPHDDHIHVELTNEAAANTALWFSDTGDTVADASTSDAAKDARADTGSHDSGTGTTTDAGTVDAAPVDPPTTVDAGSTTTTPDASAPSTPHASAREQRPVDRHRVRRSRERGRRARRDELPRGLAVREATQLVERR